MRKRNLLILLIIGIIAFVVVSSIVSSNNAAANELRELKRISVETKTLSQIVITSGSVKPESVEQQFANATGKILEVKVAENQLVNKDDILIVIEKVNASGKKENVDLRAAASGTVINMLVSQHQQVVQDQTLIAEISDLTKLKLEAEVVEADIAKIVLEQPAMAEFPALNDATADGKVSFIGIKPISSGLFGDDSRATTTGSTTQLTSTEAVNYRVDIKLDSIPEGVKIGMNADVEIIIARKESVLSIPDSYIYKKDGKSYVKVFTEGSDTNSEEIIISESEVTLGFRGETDVEVLSGLVAGQELVLPTTEIHNSRSAFSFFGDN